MKITHHYSGIVLLLFALFLSNDAKAQEALFSLRAAIDYSLENNPASTIYRNQVRLTKQQNIESLGVYLPQISGSFAFDDNLKRQVTIIPAGVFGPDETVIQFGNQYQNNAVLQLDQTIYDQSAITGFAALNVTKKVADLNVLKSNETLIYNTANAYYQVLEYDEQEKLLEQNEAQYTQLLPAVQLQYEKGVVKKIDLDRIRVSLNNIVAQKQVAATNRQLALNRLKNTMGMEMEKTMDVKDSIDYNAEVQMPSSVKADISNRFDYQIESFNIRLQQVDVNRRSMVFIPRLGFYARYGAMSFGEEFDESFRNWFDYSSIGAKLTIPIFDGMRSISQLQQSKIKLENAKANFSLLSEGYKLEFENARTQLFSSYTSLQMNRENLSLAKDVFEATSLQYRSGVASLTEFLNSDFSYKEAQANYITSLINFLSARLDYEKSQGTLTTYISQFN